jgi:hypothetical protein
MEQARGLCRPCNECHQVGAGVDCYGVERIVLVLATPSGGRNGRNLLWCHAFDRRGGVTTDLTDPTAACSARWQHFDVAYLSVSGTAH